MLSMTREDNNERRKKYKMSELQCRIEEFKKLLVRTFYERCKSVLYTLKFHLRDHVVDSLRGFRTLSVLDVSLFEQNNVHTKQAHM